MDEFTCFVCGGEPHAPGSHNFWSTADAMREAREHDRKVRVQYSSGARTAEAHYVATVRPY